MREDLGEVWSGIGWEGGWVGGWFRWVGGWVGGWDRVGGFGGWVGGWVGWVGGWAGWVGEAFTYVLVEGPVFDNGLEGSFHELGDAVRTGEED